MISRDGDDMTNNQETDHIARQAAALDDPRLCRDSGGVTDAQDARHEGYVQGVMDAARVAAAIRKDAQDRRSNMDAGTVGWRIYSAEARIAADVFTGIRTLTSADLARPSQAGDERVARLEAALREIAAMATPSANATVRRMAAAALAAMDTPKGGGDAYLA